MDVAAKLWAQVLVWTLGFLIGVALIGIGVMLAQQWMACQ